MALAIIHGTLPDLPASFGTWPARDRTIWSMCRVCWSSDPAQRFQMNQIVRFLRSLSHLHAGDSDHGGNQIDFRSPSTTTGHSIFANSADTLLAKAYDQAESSRNSWSKYAISLNSSMYRPTCWNSRDKHVLLSLSEDGRTMQFHGNSWLFIHRVADFPRFLGQLTDLIILNWDKGAMARADCPMPSACGIYYYEVTVINAGNKGYDGLLYVCHR